MNDFISTRPDIPSLTDMLQLIELKALEADTAGVSTITDALVKNHDAAHALQTGTQIPKRYSNR